MYLDLRITTPAATLSPARVKASDIVVVLDRSGSMAAENRLPYAKEAIRRLVQRLSADDRFALITFDSVAVVDTELTPVTDTVRERIVRRVQAIHPGSSTNISDGLLKARALLPGNVGERHRKVILLSDGEANMGIVDPKALAKIAASFPEHSAVLSTIGMGLGFNETLMAALADYGMGHYAYLEHLAKLGEILEQDMANTRQVFASASSLELTVGDGVTVTDVGGYPLDLTSQPGTARVATGQLLGGARKHFVVTMTVPTDRVDEISLGNIKLHYTTSQGTQSIALPRENLRIAVLEPARRDEAVASVRRDLVQQLWEGNNLGRLQKDYSHWLRSGEKQKAQQAISDYRQALQTGGNRHRSQRGEPGCIRQAVYHGAGTHRGFFRAGATAGREAQSCCQNTPRRVAQDPAVAVRCCARLLRRATYPASLAGPIAVRSTQFGAGEWLL